jgi:hypothetical protein
MNAVCRNFVLVAHSEDVTKSREFIQDLESQANFCKLLNRTLLTKSQDPDVSMSQC